MTIVFKKMIVMSGKKVLIFVHNIVNRAGIQRAVVNLSGILVKQGYKVFIASIQTTEGDCPYDIDPSVQIIHLGIIPRKRNKIQMFFFRKQFFKIIKNNIKLFTPDIVIGTTYFVSSLLSLLSKRIIRIGCEHFCYEIAKKQEKKGKRKFYKKLDAVVLLTERDRKEYTFVKNTYVIPNCLSFVPQKTADCKAKKIISLGRFSYQKNFSLLIECVKKIKDSLEGWVVELYGYGEEKMSLQEQVEKNNLTHIIKIKDAVSDVESVYNSASIFLSSSRFEGFPMVLIEAQSCGLPVVSFDCPCGPSDIIIDGKTGFIVPVNDVNLYSEKILELVNNEDLRIKMGRNASIESIRFSEASISDLWKNLLTSLMDK